VRALHVSRNERFQPSLNIVYGWYPFRRIVSIDAVDGSGRVVEFPFGELSVLRVDLTANTPSEAYGIFMQRNYGENTAADR
jgi:hypothetical protein